jgi:acyl-CoA reductase-like NAD-dependent aldehyde dehydrogenase
MVLAPETNLEAGNIAVPPPAVSGPEASPSDVEAAVADVAARSGAWASLGVGKRIALLERMITDTDAVAAEWAEAECERKGVPFRSPAAGEEWFLGPCFLLRDLRLLRDTLRDCERYGRPRLPGRVRTTGTGRVAARIYPGDPYDRLFFTGVTGEVWMPPGVGAEELDATIGGIYREGADRRGRVAAVLGAGNVSAIPPTDVLSKLFAEDQVAVLKLNRITDHLEPIYGRAFAALVEGGYLRIVHGGVPVASALIEHPAVDTVHLTGSDKTYDAIVFGPGAGGRRRKEARRPRLAKPVTAELGNVTPVIVVPGPWSNSDIAFQAATVATMLVHGGGYECIAPRVLLTHAGWDRRADFLDALRHVLRGVPHRPAFYPGGAERVDLFRVAHPEAECLGAGDPGTLPWVLIPGVDAAGDDVVFTTDPFAPVLAESPLPGATPAEFVERAVAFCNERMWGTLGASILVHPAARKDPALAAAVERAIADLRYGAVAVNTSPGIAFALLSPPWGAFPGHEPHDIRSGTGFVHNTFLFTNPEKTVMRAPFRTFPPRPPWMVTHPYGRQVLSRLARFEADPSPARLPGIVFHTLRGQR